MATKYFLAQNSNRVIAGVRFETVNVFAGTLIGVFATDNEKLQEKLLSDPIKSTGVEEITVEQYDEYIKKKTSQHGRVAALEQRYAEAGGPERHQGQRCSTCG